MIHQARSYLTGAVLATTLIVVAIVAFMLIVSAQALRDWPTAGIGGGNDSISVSAAQRISPAKRADSDAGRSAPDAADSGPSLAATPAPAVPATGGGPALAGGPAPQDGPGASPADNGGQGSQPSAPGIADAVNRAAPGSAVENNAGTPSPQNSPGRDPLPAPAANAPPIISIPDPPGVVTATVEEAITEVDSVLDEAPQTNTPGSVVADEVVDEVSDGVVDPETPAGEVVEEVADPTLDDTAEETVETGPTGPVGPA